MQKARRWVSRTHTQVLLLNPVSLEKVLRQEHSGLAGGAELAEKNKVSESSTLTLNDLTCPVTEPDILLALSWLPDPLS